MNISIGLRLFSAVLLSIITVALVTLLVMREKVSASFSDYAVRIELDRLQEIGDAVQEQYALQNNWKFLPTDDAEKRIWISQELLRLKGKRQMQNQPLEDVNPGSAVDTRASVSPVEKHAPKQAAPAKSSLQASTKIIAADDMDLPPLPPPASPLPPLPPIPPAPPVPLLPPPLTTIVHWFSRLTKQLI